MKHKGTTTAADWAVITTRKRVSQAVNVMDLDMQSNDRFIMAW